MTRTLILFGALTILAMPMASAINTDPIYTTISYSCADVNGTHDCVGAYNGGCWGYYVERDGELVQHYGIC